MKELLAVLIESPAVPLFPSQRYALPKGQIENDKANASSREDETALAVPTPHDLRQSRLGYWRELFREA